MTAANIIAVMFAATIVVTLLTGLIKGVILKQEISDRQAKFMMKALDAIIYFLSIFSGYYFGKND